MNEVPTWTATITEETELLNPSETRIAELFVERNGERFRYVAEVGAMVPLGRQRLEQRKHFVGT